MAIVLKFGELTFSVTHHALACNGVPVVVGGRCLDLLARLLEQPGQLVPVDELMRAGWGKLRVQPNNLSVQISALRKALGPRPDGTPYIRAVAGRGYMLATEVERHDDERQGARRSWPGAAVNGFVGRTAELAELCALLDGTAQEGARLVTVAGMGGVGKTRLVQEALVRLTRPWAGVDLAPCTGSDQVLAAVASALGDVRATADAVMARLRASPLLLILDNAEHVVAELEPILPRLLAECPGTAVLVTSRIVLRVAGEVVFRLAPLSLPPASATGLAAIAGFDGVKLFAERARAVQPGFVLSDANCRDVAEICRKLDGIAFAIETLVPRLRAMSPAEILARLDERFGLLGGTGRDVLPRQRTLRTMLDWSWELLDEAERAALVRLAVFRAPATLAALAGLGGGDGGAEGGRDCLDAVAGLTDKSLAVAEPGGREMQFRLMQTTRDYVTAITPPATLRALRGRHAGFMAGWMEQARNEWPTVPTTDWLERRMGGMDDLREALAWAAGEGGDGDDGAVAVRLVSASLPLWLEAPGTPLGEMSAWFDRVEPLLRADTPAGELAWFRIGQSWRATQFGDVQHRTIAGQAVAAARLTGHRETLGVALMRYGHTFMDATTMAAAAGHFVEAERHLRAIPPGKWLCLVLTRQADAVVRLGRLEKGLQLYDEAIDLAHALEFQLGQVISISNMTEVLFAMGEQEGATHQLRSLVARIPPGARSPAMATFAAHLALADRPGEALDAALDVAEWAPVTGMEGPLAWAAETVALLLARAGRLHAAAAMAGYARRVLPAVGIRFGSRRAVHRELHTRLAGTLALADLDAFEAVGAAWTLPQAVAAITVSDLHVKRRGRPLPGNGPDAERAEAQDARNAVLPGVG